MIKAPFNFVPLNKNIFFPEDTNRVSQDVPFSDGKSGTISIKIIAESPMFISDKHNNGQTEYFCHTPAENQNDWKYFIPGTSIKGAIRNVMEILSFGKMTQVQNRSFTIRDLYRGKKNEDDDETTDLYGLNGTGDYGDECTAAHAVVRQTCYSLARSPAHWQFPSGRHGVWRC